MKKELLIHEGFMTFHSGKRPLQSGIVCGVLSDFTLVVGQVTLIPASCGHTVERCSALAYAQRT